MADANIELIVATLDLALVRSIRNAVRANLIAAGGVPGPLGTVTNPGPRGDRYDPEPRFEPRRVIHPEPRYERRPVIHPTPRVEILPAWAIEPEQPARPHTLLPPPWKMPIPMETNSSPLVVKYEQASPEIISKGSLLDTFI